MAGVNLRFPQGTKTLFFAQAFAIIPFSMLYSTIMLYATSRLHLTDDIAASITGSYLAFNMGLSLLGGYIAGRLLSNRTLFVIAMSFQIIANLLLSIPTHATFVWGLSAMLVGACFCVTNLNCMLTQLFEPNDKQRETAFLWSYSSMNVGAFIGFSISGYCQLHSAYSTLFYLGAVGNLISLIITCLQWKVLFDRKTLLTQKSPAERSRSIMLGIGIIIVMFFALRILLGHADFSNDLVKCVGVFMIGVLAYLATQQEDHKARKKLWAYLILAFTALIFWTLYLVAPMALVLFIERNVDKHFLGFTIAPQWVQNINTIVIILGGPTLSIVFNKLREKGMRVTIPIQFSIALVLIGAGLAILPLGIHLADAQGHTHFNWIFWSYVLQSLGELFLSPIGYAMVGQLVPTHLQGLLMGAWLMITGIAATIAEYFSKMALTATQSVDPLVTNLGFAHTFNLLGWGSIVAGLLLMIFVPLMLRLTHENEQIIEQEFT